MQRTCKKIYTLKDKGMKITLWNTHSFLTTQEESLSSIKLYFEINLCQIHDIMLVLILKSFNNVLEILVLWRFSITKSEGGEGGRGGAGRVYSLYLNEHEINFFFQKKP